MPTFFRPLINVCLILEVAPDQPEGDCSHHYYIFIVFKDLAGRRNSLRQVTRRTKSMLDWSSYSSRLYHYGEGWYCPSTIFQGSSYVSGWARAVTAHGFIRRLGHEVFRTDMHSAHFQLGFRGRRSVLLHSIACYL